MTDRAESTAEKHQQKEESTVENPHDEPYMSSTALKEMARKRDKRRINRIGLALFVPTAVVSIAALAAFVAPWAGIVASAFAFVAFLDLLWGALN